MDKFLQKWVSWSNWLRGVVWVSLSAQLATLPLVAWYYNLISPVSLFANLVAVPLVGLVLLLGVVASLIGIFSINVAGILNVSTGAVLDLFVWLVSFLHQLPGAVLFVPTPPWAVVAGWFVGLFAAGWFWTDKDLRRRFASNRRLKQSATLCLILILAAIFIWLAWRSGGEQLAVHFIDVGQGDCALIQSPGGKTMLIDSGGWPDEFKTGSGVGDRVVVPYLRRLGVQKLDVLVLTHPDEDHTAGAASIIRNMPVGLVVWYHRCADQPFLMKKVQRKKNSMYRL